MGFPKIIYLYPEENEDNLYISLCSDTWRRLGAEVVAFPRVLGDLFRLLIGGRKEVIVLNWFEDRLAYSSFQILGFLKCFVLLAIMRITFKKIVWVRHNFRPHGSCSKLLFSALKKLLFLCSDVSVVHRHVDCIDTKVVPHPLYPSEDKHLAQERDIPFLYFGSVKPYKGLESLLECWPSSKCLFMAGYCSDKAYAELLKGIISRRGLSVNWIDEFLQYGDLCTLIGRARFVIIPHVESSMIVSGTFFHAASLGANVISLSSGFYRNYMKEFSFTSDFQYETIEADLDRVVYQSPDIVIAEISECCSPEKIAVAWRGIIESCS